MLTTKSSVLPDDVELPETETPSPLLFVEDTKVLGGIVTPGVLEDTTLPGKRAPPLPISMFIGSPGAIVPAPSL